MVRGTIRQPNGEYMAQSVKGALGNWLIEEARLDAKPCAIKRSFIHWPDLWRSPTYAFPRPGDVSRSVVANVREKGGMLSPYDVQHRLQNHGWTLLGCGATANVFEHPKHPDKVIKLAMRRDPWPEYIQFAKEAGELGKLAPRVYALKPLMHGYWAVMERLFHRAAYTSLDQDKPFYKSLANWQRNNDYGWDCCGSNIMERKNGELVITDPVCGCVNEDCLTISPRRKAA